MEPTKDDLATVATFLTAWEAGLAKERLESEGVDAFILEGLSGSLMPYISGAAVLGGIHLQVRNEDLEKAREILGPA
jgi:hypothetical protein